MRALFVSHAYALPDARAKLRALAGLGYSIAAAVSEHAGSVAASDELGVQLIPVPVRGDRWDPRALARAVADFAPGLIQIEEEPWTPVAARAAALAARHKVTLIQYTADTGSTTPSLAGRARRARVLRHVSAVLAANEPAAARSRELRPGVPIAIVPQLGVTAPPAAGMYDSSHLALGFVGRLVSSKGLDLLLRALVNLHGDWTLTVVGTGPAQEQLEALGASLGLAGRLRWLGALSRERLSALWPTLNALVLPARTVPISADPGMRIVLEAMAHGIPAVVTPAGVLAETVSEGGLVVPEGDEAALRDALQQLHDQPALRAELGSAARRRILGHYSPDAIARRTAELWSAAIAAS